MTDRLAQSRKHWDDLGRLDPFHAILSRPGTRLGRWDLDEFFATGQREIADLMEYAARIGLPKERNRALDFGCGVGRLTQPLAEYFEECTGVDISDSMVRRAKELSKSEKCHFLLNDRPTLPFPNHHFDLIYTSIVLQHVPQKTLIRRYISEFVRTLKKDGLLVMQIPSHIKLRNRLQPKRRLYELLRGIGVSESYLYQALRLTPMLMNFLPEPEVFSVVEAAAGRVLSSVPDKLAPYERASHIASRIYYVTK
jgi:ubiquinone/menaquinone biosynthesis C-methylase UbiE